MHLRNSWTRSMSSCCMRHVPSGASGCRGLNGLILFFTSKFHETSVTKSLMSGNAFIGSVRPACSYRENLAPATPVTFCLPIDSAQQDPPFFASRVHQL